MSRTFFWHDYETFGAVPRLDRPSQFAGIRTDEDLNEIEAPVEWFCQPTEDYVPHPEACLLTHITPQQAEERGIPEPEFIDKINAELSRPNTCAVGYNTLRFDDEVTRYTLWRNLRDPYAREWRDGCSRWDIIDMVRLTYALRPEGINWPTHEDGKPSFKLEHLAAANGLEQDQAHDAVSDVRATIALARLIKEKQPKLFDYVLGNKGKQDAWSQIDLREFTPVVHVSSMFPADLGCLSLVMPICPDPKVPKNKVLVYDLRHDPSELLELSPEDIHERIFTARDALPEGVERIAVKHIHMNRCPVIAPAKTLTEAQAQRLQLDLNQCRQYWKIIRDNHDIIAAKLTAVFELGGFEPSDDPEQDLYGGFVGNDDRALCEELADMSLADLLDANYAENPPAFRDNRLHELFFRYRARHFPETLNAFEQEEWQRWRAKRLEFAPDGGQSLLDFEQMLDRLRSQFQNDADELQILSALTEWGQRLRQHI